MRYAKLIGRVALVVGTVAGLQGCAQFANVQVPMLPQENSSVERSMLSLYNPLPFQHRSLSQGTWLRSPENRNSRYIYLGY